MEHARINSNLSKGESGNMKKKPVIGVLLGDYSGIGTELVVKCLQSGELSKDAVPLIIGHESILKREMELLQVSLDYEVISSETDLAKMEQENLGRITVYELQEAELGGIGYGKLNPVCGQAVFVMIAKAVELYQKGIIDGICYAPFNKGAMKLVRPDVESELQLFQEAMEYTGLTGEMNVVEGLWTSRVTSHIPLARIGQYLSRDKIEEAILLADQTMKAAGIAAPRIAVCALNPHAGENGLCGREEIDMIQPAIAAAVEKRVCVAGPFPSDTIFIRAFRGEFDGVVTLYHDQGQIALKLKDFANAVTVAAGLPAPVTTPAHGTAFDIAGQGAASANAFLSAYRIVAAQAAGRTCRGHV